MRKCNNCFQIKPLTEFYKKKAGHQYACKSCAKELVYGYRLRKIENKWDKIYKDDKNVH
jgi:hypothetical protein